MAAAVHSFVVARMELYLRKENVQMKYAALKKTSKAVICVKIY